MTPYVADPVYLNGRYLPLAEAGISPLDRGFLCGDGAYELVPVYSRRPFRLAEHLTRLQATLDGIRLANPKDARGWATVVERLIAEAPWDDQSIYLQVTRGADNKRDDADRDTGERCRSNHCRRRPLGPLRPQGRLPARQHPRAPAGGRCRLRRSPADPRRPAQGGSRLEHLRRQGWCAARPAEDVLHAARHHLRRCS